MGATVEVLLLDESLKVTAAAASRVEASTGRQRNISAAIWVNELMSGLMLVSFQARMRRLGGMSISGTDLSPAGRSCPRGASPMVPFQSTAYRHSWTVRITGPWRSGPSGSAPLQ